MKKGLISCLICVFLTLVLLSAAAADTNPPKKLGGTPWEVDDDHEDVLDVFNANKQMQIGENEFVIEAGMRKNLGFMPTESGYYAIYSTGTYDTYGMLRDPNLNVYTEDDDSGQNRNFRMVYELTANTPYLVGVQFYSQSASGTVTVVLEKLVNPCGDNLTWSFDAPTGTLTITGSGMMWSFDDGMPWAMHVHDITSVSLPDGITSVAPFAFAACDNLTSINIQASITSIGKGAFMGCRSLTPEGISIDPDCTRYYMEGGVLYFRGEGWSLGTYLASNPEKTYKITGNMDAIDDYAFADCDNLVAVTIDDVGLYDINEGTFMDCSSLEYAGLYNVSRIDKKAFWDCASLRRIVVTTELDLVEANAFVNCNALSHVYYLGTEAQRNANLTIDSSGNDALLNATWHYVDDVSTFMCGDYLFWYYNSEMHALAIEGVGDMWDFEWKASPWYAYNDEMQAAVIDSDVTRIGNYAFMNCSEIAGFTLPQGLQSIGANAFENNHTMTTIEIPASVKAIEEHAFAGCDVLETVTLHEGLLTIGEKAFFDCWELEAFHIPASVTSIGVGAFRSCSSLTAETFSVAPGSTSYRVEDGILFTYDRDLLHTCLMTNPQTEYTVPEDVTEIADFAFEECDALVTVRLPRWLYVIGENAFSGCENLATADLPANLSTIGEDAFSGTAITVVRIPKSVTRIEPWTFSYCSSLKTIEIPKSVTYIGEGAFHQYQNAITDVYYTGTETERNANLTIDNANNYNDDFLNATWHYIPIAFKSQALTLEGRIGVNFFIDLPQDEAIEYEGVSFTIDSIDGAETFVPFTGTSHPKNSSGYYQFTYYTRTIEMANTITATLRYTLNGKAGTLEKTYSVKQYFETFDQYISLFNEKQQNMVKATADLGHYVQAFLAAQKEWTFGTDYAEMDKHYADYTAADITAAQTALAPYAVNKSTGTNMQKITYSLVLDSDTELLVYFKPASGYTGTFTFTVNGTPIAENGEKISVALQSDGRYMVSIKNIAAHELGNEYVIKAMSDGDEASITVSALSYANAMITGYANNSEWANAAIAIWRYAAAAEAMRH